jgi:hypothetical protein
MTPYFLSTGPCKEPATRHAPFGGRRVSYLIIVLVNALATFSAGIGFWQAQSPNAAAMNRTLAKFTDFMDRIQPAGA